MSADVEPQQATAWQPNWLSLSGAIELAITRDQTITLAADEACDVEPDVRVHRAIERVRPNRGARKLTRGCATCFGANASAFLLVWSQHPKSRHRLWFGRAARMVDQNRGLWRTNGRQSAGCSSQR